MVHLTFTRNWARAAVLLLTTLCCLTGARAQKVLPYTYGFEDNNLSADGWVLQATSSSTGFNSNAAHSGSSGFQFNFSEQNAYLLSPILTGGVNGVDLSFWYKEYSSSYGDEQFQVGYTTDEKVTDPSEFTYGDVVTASTSWQEYTNTFPGGTVRIAIKYIYNDAWFLFLDDFSFEASSCAIPTDLAIDFTEGSTTATVTWNGEASSYNIDVNGTVTTGVTSSFVLEDLQPSTTYTIKVQADCGDEQSKWVSTSFFTGCPEAYPIPYAYGFEDLNSIDCWTLSAPDNMVIDDQEPQFARTGNNFFFFNYTTNPPQYLISPQLTGIENGLHVEFYYCQYTNGVETFKVGYSTTDNNPESFIWGDEITASTSYQRFSANYPADVKYVAIQHTSYNQYYLFVDDFLFEESASCLEPTSLVATNETTTGATVSWTAGGDETTWEIYVTDDYTDVPDVTATPTVSGITVNPYDLTGLTPCTTYYLYVRAVKGTDNSAWSSPVVFNTKCEPMALPYEYGFDDNDLPISWKTINDNTSYNNVSITAADGNNNVLAFQIGGTSNSLVAVLPEVDEAYPLNGYQISFDACYANTSSTNMTYGKLRIGIMTDPEDFSTFELIEEVEINDGYSVFGSHTVMFNNYTGTGRYIAIQDVYTRNGYVLVDNIKVTKLPACIAPTELTAVTVSGNSAELTWTANNGESSWTLYYKKSSDETYTSVSVTEDSYTLTGLDASTNYDCYVEMWCAESEENMASKVFSFKTLFAPITNFPWTENFDGLTEDYSIPDGWDNTEGTTTVTNYKWGYNTITNGNGSATGTGHDGTNCVVFNSYNNSNGMTNFLKTIPLVLPDEPAMQLTFWYKNPAGGDLSVYISTDGGTTHETALATGLIGASEWTQYDPINLSAYAGQQVLIVFKGTSNYGYNDAYIYLDDVTVMEAPSCAAPSDLAAANITINSAELSWTVNSGEEAWTIYYKEAEDENYTSVDVDVNPYTLTGLKPGTVYDVYVTAICSDTDQSMASRTFSFATKCDEITQFPWSEDFEAYSAGVFTDPCWVNEHIAGTSTHVFNVYSPQGGDNQSNQLQLPDQQTGNMTKLVLPAMSLNNANYQFSIDVYRSSGFLGKTTEGIRVFASADGEIEGATELAFIPRAYSTGNDVIPAEETNGWYTYNLPLGMSGTCYIILRGESKYGEATYIDNFIVSEIPAIELADDADNTSLIEDNDGKLADVTLSGRTLYKDGTWNTLVLPFNYDLTADGNVLEGADVRSLSGASYSGNKLKLNFTSEGDVDEIEAGKPYIIRWKTASDTNLESPVFNGVTIDKTKANTVADLGDEKTLVFQGIYAPLSFETDETSVLFLGADNKLYWPQKGAYVGAQRAIFSLSGFSADDAAGVRFVLDFGEDGGTTTGIISVNDGKTVETGDWYDLNGRKLDNMPARKGVYIRNGKKEVIK